MSDTAPVSRFAPPAFRGETFSEELDGERLRTLLDRVRHLMLDGSWRTLSEIARKTGGSEASVSARLRDLRRAEHGGWSVERERTDAPGIWRYRVTVRQMRTE